MSLLSRGKQPIWLRRIANRLRRLRRAGVCVWYHPEYRLPLTSAESVTGMEPRRADFVSAYLLDSGVISEEHLKRPRRINYSELSLAHTPELLERLHNPAELARIYASDPSEFRMDELLRTIRLACGGTLAATEWALQKGCSTFNLLGGFHHAGKSRTGGFCPVNDIATAVYAMRARGFNGRVNILDLDAHPPDGTSESFEGDSSIWIGSISAVDWGEMPNVDETLLPAGTEDTEYLAALSRLLGRMPQAELTYVLAGGDVLAEDKLGGFSLTLKGVRERDLLISWYLGSSPAVWLPGGGYHEDAWKVLAGSVVAVALDSNRPLPQAYDPMSSRFARISRGLERSELEGLDDLSMRDLMGDFRASQGAVRFLGFYTRDGCEYALQRYGILRELERRGYSNFEIKLDEGGVGDRLRVFGDLGSQKHLLIECVAEVQRAEQLLFVNWLTLQNPHAQFNAGRSQLPGQQHPGLGLAREAGELLRRAAERLELRGVAFRPASYHLAYAARDHSSFIDPARQGRFEALVRDLEGLPLLIASRLVASGEVFLNGEKYSWEPELMVDWRVSPWSTDQERAEVSEQLARERESSHFTYRALPKSADASSPPSSDASN